MVERDGIPTGSDRRRALVAPAKAPAHRGAQCLARLTLAHHTAHALGGVTVADPSNWATPCLALNVLEALYVSLLGLGGLSERRLFAHFSVSPAALARAENAAATADSIFRL